MTGSGWRCRSRKQAAVAAIGGAETGNEALMRGDDGIGTKRAGNATWK